MKMLRKAALQVGAAMLLLLLACNAYIAVKHLRNLQSIAAHSLESSLLRADIAGVLQDLTDMETGQRGYLLTGNDSYLQPYTAANDKIAGDFARIRAELSNRSEREQTFESQVESLARSKQAEMERSISLRQRGYRRRAFKLVDSNEGMEYMEKARGLLSSLSQVETDTIAKLEHDRNAGLRRGLVQIIGANCCLLILTTCLLALIRYHARSLETEASRSKKEFAERDLQLKKLTSILSTQARSKTSALEANARLLLQEYGGFLPRQGHACAEQIKEASEEMEQLRQELLDTPSCDIGSEQPALDCVA